MRHSQVIWLTCTEVWSFFNNCLWWCLEYNGSGIITTPRGFSRVCVWHLGRQQVHLHDVKTSHTRNSDSHNLLQQENQSWDQEPLPEVCTVNHEQRPDPDIGQVRPVKHLQEKQHTVFSPCCINCWNEPVKTTESSAAQFVTWPCALA